MQESSQIYQFFFEVAPNGQIKKSELTVDLWWAWTVALEVAVMCPHDKVHWLLLIEDFFLTKNRQRYGVKTGNKGVPSLMMQKIKY